jgi:hypothetical protein
MVIDHHNYSCSTTALVRPYPSNVPLLPVRNSAFVEQLEHRLIAEYDTRDSSRVLRATAFELVFE